LLMSENNNKYVPKSKSDVKMLTENTLISNNYTQTE